MPLDSFQLQTSSPPGYQITATDPSITPRHNSIHQKMDLTPCLVLYRGGRLPWISILEQGKFHRNPPAELLAIFMA